MQSVNEERATSSLPKCPAHDKEMILLNPTTEEQRFCGTWYRCPQCANGVLYPSSDLLEFLDQQKTGQMKLDI